MDKEQELKLELLRIVSDKNNSEVNDIIKNAEKLHNWILGTSPNNKGVVNKSAKPTTLLDEEDKKTIDNMVLTNLLSFYTLHGSMENRANGHKISYDCIPDYWNDDKKALYKKFINFINSRRIGNSGFTTTVKSPIEVLLQNKLKKGIEKQQKIMENRMTQKEHVESTNNGDDSIIEKDAENVTPVESYSNKFATKEEEEKFIKEWEEEEKRKEYLERSTPYSEESSKIAEFYGMVPKSKEDMICKTEHGPETI